MRPELLKSFLVPAVLALIAASGCAGRPRGDETEAIDRLAQMLEGYRPLELETITARLGMEASDVRKEGSAGMRDRPVITTVALMWLGDRQTSGTWRSFHALYNAPGGGAVEGKHRTELLLRLRNYGCITRAMVTQRFGAATWKPGEGMPAEPSLYRPRRGDPSFDGYVRLWVSFSTFSGCADTVYAYSGYESYQPHGRI